MCTNITLKNNNGDYLLARTMDFSFELEPEMLIIPRNYPMKFALKDSPLENHYAFAGLGKNIGSYTIADGVNEFGLSGAALYFAGYAHYDDIVEDVNALAPHEYIMWMLATCKTIDDVKDAIAEHAVSGVELEFLGTTPPLHWSFQDISGNAIIVEPTIRGIEIHENKIGVLTNSPDYAWHLTNVRNYIGLDPVQVESRTLFGQEFEPFGQGSGTFGVPGDLTPPSRFIKTLYTKLSAKKTDTERDMVIAASHILNGVDIPKGSVITKRNTIDYTQYMSFMVATTQTYYYKLYDDFTTHVVKLQDYDLDAREIIKVI
ncbi:choloylglycine hydrolase family protein [Erysipelothrix sp. HDW6C]|uniref:choloylglycine hydrolase family protein n=1 Tax=Erysipelothrix sp. HDW6C TaxID=2714930 RepID=UPI00140BB224|nr:choloylglycine hydrolase family protein [Erysipelothrix sp. HDW6C]QIK69132.1 choloylglycine hydrolase family protein [Erysipelothrix sp. HDW6C]